MASAAITEDGALEPVEGLQLKIETITNLMPQTRRLLVAADQKEQALEYAAGRLEVIGVASASQALEEVFGDGLADLLLQEGSDANRREQLADWFFRFSLTGRGELVDWSPVAVAARRALETWSELTNDQRFKLGFARGVAERHEWNGGTLPVPSGDWLLARPAPLRTHLVAHLVQQVADAGQPLWSEVQPLVSLVRQPVVTEAHAMQLRLEGALARLWAVTGRPLDALKLQEELARAYFDSLLYSDVSFPLAEWFRLSGVVGDQGSFDRADKMRAAVDAVGGFGLHGSVYVDLARCKALSCLHPIDGTVIATFSKIAHESRAPQHVRWSAARWLFQHRDAVHDRVRAALWTAMEQTAALTNPRHSHAAAVNLALARLDAGIRVTAVTQCDEAVAQLRALEPGLFDHLKAAAPLSEVAKYIARHYPY